MSKNKSKVNMPKDIKNKCHKIIHTASITAGAAGAIPIPIADTIPITAAQIAMVVGLGKVFDITISDSVAKSILGTGLAKEAGRFVAKELIKLIPGIGPAINATTAAALTEAMGWLVADDFYRISVGERPENITEAINDIKGTWKGY